MWLTRRLASDFKTIADLRHDNGKDIRNVCRRSVELCRELKLFTQAVVAVDGSKFKAANNRDRNFTPHKRDQRMRHVEESIERYLSALGTADRTRPVDLAWKTARLQTPETLPLFDLMAQLDRPIWLHPARGARHPAGGRLT